MEPTQFRERCPKSYVLCRAKLADFRFVITSRGYASILPRKRAVTHGLLCALTPADEAELDRREGVPNKVYRKAWLDVTTEARTLVRALVYIDNTTTLGSPKAGYLEKIVHGATHHRLPAAVIRALKRWALPVTRPR